MSRSTRPRFARIALGRVDVLRAAGVSRDAILLDVHLRTHRAKRSLPGLLEMGIAGLAESLSETPKRVQQWLAQLEHANQVMVDREARLIFAVGAAVDDGPSTEQAVVGMSRQWRELPESPITEAIALEIERSLDEGNRQKLLPLWLTETARTRTHDASAQSAVLTRSAPASDSGPESASESVTQRASLPSPSPSPLPMSRDPETATPTPAVSAAVADFLNWFTAEYRTALGVAYQRRDKDADCVGSLLAEYDADELRTMAALMLRTTREDDSWLVEESDRSIGVLKHRAAKLWLRLETFAPTDPPPSAEQPCGRVHDATVWCSHCHQRDPKGYQAAHASEVH